MLFVGGIVPSFLLLLGFVSVSVGREYRRTLASGLRSLKDRLSLGVVLQGAEELFTEELVADRLGPDEFLVRKGVRHDGAMHSCPFSHDCMHFQI